MILAAVMNAQVLVKKASRSLAALMLSFGLGIAALMLLRRHWQGKCCEHLCTQNYLTVGGVKRFRIANANRSSAERRVFARLLVWSMVQASENVTLALILFLSHRFASVNIPSFLQEKKRKVNYVLSDGTNAAK